MSRPRASNPARKAGEHLTMADLAELAGVSAITVSRALRDSPLVNPETRQRIKELAERQGYHFNISARNLRLRRSMTVAVVVEMKPTIERQMSGPYPLDLLGGISQELTSAGYSVLLTSLQGGALPSVQAADGVILLGQGAHEDAMHEVRRWGRPMVVWGAVSRHESQIVVGSDNHRGGKLAAERFLALGRRRPVFLGDSAHGEFAERLEGFQQTLAGHGIEALTIVGSMSHMCIDAATRAAADLGYDVTVAHDACATLALDFDGKQVPAADVHASAMAALAFAYAKVVKTDELLDR